MKNRKLSLFVLALTLSIGVSSGVYACEQNKTTKGVKPTSVAQKIDSKEAKTQQWEAKFLKNHEDKKNFNKCHKDFEKANEHKYDKIKPVISVADKAALKVKTDKIAIVKDANKVLKTTIIKNAQAVKVELKRIEDSKIVLDPVVKTEADSVLLAVKDSTTKKICVNPVVPTLVPVSVVAPVVPIVEPIVPVVPVEKNYLEKLNERLDNVFQKSTEKNTQLTTLGTRLLNLLNALTLIK
ncbi:hypothetical protein LGL55_09140 [Clostridium tagluense]|uniref:hypothetical protein n=1 Tax=Clostridium tagluense TaxID=360422 RepID=UPI001C0B61CF|nr:hypothetical protein [Clostridium tagluense]MBU3128000.1 hypothetical protein [Clostridium tagluense]MCB2311416.1 hypothetical protein [Clostridium tagluense]MCB2316140.1 hypothetical protein [Clostridium tagluense]MCB2321057.1 hypothetical protein [Clostridium tagluense]MCB2326073.1 hypothetical protein [Clostridium tagluense]